MCFHVVSSIYSWPILANLQKMTNSELVNVDHPMPKDYAGLVSTHPVD